MVRKNLEAYLTAQYADVPLIYIRNRLFSKTNNIYSLFLAKEYMNDDSIIIESDLISFWTFVINLYFPTKYKKNGK